MCTHDPQKFLDLKPFDILRVLITDKQIKTYLKNVEQLIESINFFDNTLKTLSCIQLQQKLGVKCARSFALSMCLYCIYVLQNPVDFSELFFDTNPNTADIRSRCAIFHCNNLDSKYLNINAQALLKLIYNCVQQGALLCCTVTKDAESWSCGCGVKCTLRASRSYSLLYKNAIREVDASMTMVIQN